MLLNAMAQGGQSVARDDGSDNRIARLKILLDEERQHRQQQVERKEKQKVSGTKAQVVLIEKLLFHDIPIKRAKIQLFEIGKCRNFLDCQMKNHAALI